LPGQGELALIIDNLSALIRDITDVPRLVEPELTLFAGAFPPAPSWKTKTRLLTIGC